MTNEWLQGYIAALKNLEAFCETTKLEKNYDQQRALEYVVIFIHQVRENYKQLVEDLNEKSKK